MTSSTAVFRQARDTLIAHRTDYERAQLALQAHPAAGIRGVELQCSLGTRRPLEFWEEDFGELKRE